MSLTSKTPLSITSFGVPARDVIIIGIALVISLIILATPFAVIFVRIVAAAALFSASVVYAFWRVDRVWPIEVYLMNKYGWEARKRFFVKGGAQSDSLKPPAVAAATYDAPALFWLPGQFSPKSNLQLFFSMLSIFVLVVFLSWIGTGGIEQAQALIRTLSRSIR